MRISFRHKFVMFDVPKSASTSINYAIRTLAESVLDGAGPVKHIQVKHYEMYLEPLLIETIGEKEARSLTRIAVVREPVDMVMSYYKYLQRPGVEDPSNVDHYRNTLDVPFLSFVQRICGQSEVRHPGPVSWPSSFCADQNGKIGIDLLFSFEKLEKLAGYLSELSGEEIRLQKNNVSPDVEDAKANLEIEQLIKTAFPLDVRLYKEILENGGSLEARGKSIQDI